MIQIEKLVVNPFMLNTLLLYDESSECVVIDPGFSNQNERMRFKNFIAQAGLKPVKLINTHCHVDHILGNKFINNEFGLPLIAHVNETSNLQIADATASIYGLPKPDSPSIGIFLSDGDIIEFGHSKLKVLFTPGHTAGGISLYSEQDKIVIVGDLLFQGSIGRTDFPGGNYDTLIASVNDKIFTLPDDVKVFSGHGNETTVGYERQFNPFFND